MLLIAGWHASYFFIGLFVAFVPLLFLQANFSQNKKPNYQLLQHVFVAFLLFTIVTTYWLAKYSLVSAVTVWLYHALCLSAVFMLFNKAYIFFGKIVGYLAFVSFYLGFEYLTLNTNCFWPWLNLGNGLAGQTNIIQWYEFTGVAGGSFWVLSINLLLFLIIEKWWSSKSISKKMVLVLVLYMIVPIALSHWLGFARTLIKYQKEKIVVVQPNVKQPVFDITALTNWKKPEEERKYLSPLLKNVEQASCAYLVLPETAITEGFGVKHSNKVYSSVGYLKKYLKQNGVLIYGAYGGQKNQKFNIAVFESDSTTFFHIKNKLVPGVEVFPFIKKYKAGLGVPFEKKYYSTISQKAYASQQNFPTAICYESVFGNEVAAQASYKNKPIIIITNDGWFDNTTLIKQHLNLAKLRAIENRRFVVRSANSGISAVISNTGEILKHLPNNKAGIIEAVVPQKHLTKTFYQKYTDIIYRIGALISLILLLYIFVATFTTNFKFKKLGFT